MDIKETYENHQEDIDSVEAWCEEVYKDKFWAYFQNVHDLYKRIKSKSHPITDEELEMILTELPLDLFKASEALSNFKTGQEVIRISIKKMKSMVSTIDTLDDELLITAYSNIINRVEKELSFSRELIMGAKKIWDSRRSSEKMNPVKEVVSDEPDLPPYFANSRDKKTYITS